MIAAVAHNDTNEDRVILIGLGPQNVHRLVEGEPIRIAPETHPGFPADLKVLIVFSESERKIVEALKPFFSDHTKFVASMPADDTPPS